MFNVRPTVHSATAHAMFDACTELDRGVGANHLLAPPSARQHLTTFLALWRSGQEHEAQAHLQKAWLETRGLICSSVLAPFGCRALERLQAEAEIPRCYQAAQAPHPQNPAHAVSPEMMELLFQQVMVAVKHVVVPRQRSVELSRFCQAILQRDWTTAGCAWPAALIELRLLIADEVLPPIDNPSI